MPDEFPATSAKRVIRARARAARAAFGRHPIHPPAAFVALLDAGLTLASYRPTANEADPSLMALAALDRGARLALPYLVDRATSLRFLAWSAMEDELETGPFGLSQPMVGAAEVEPDVILTPLVAFDGMLNRIGQGGGHYDRIFARFPQAKRIGVAYSVQQVERIPPELWDMPLDAVVTEQGWFER